MVNPWSGACICPPSSLEWPYASRRNDCPTHGSLPVSSHDLDDDAETADTTPVVSFADLIQNAHQHAGIDDSFMRQIEQVVASRMAARDAELQRLVVGILSGVEGTTTATLVYDTDGIPHGVYGGIGEPYTIVEQLPLFGFSRVAGFTAGELPRTVRTIPQRWSLELEDGRLIPISKRFAAVLIEDGDVTAELMIDDVGTLKSTDISLRPGAVYVCGHCDGRTWPTARRLQAHMLAEHPAATYDQQNDPNTEGDDSP